MEQELTLKEEINADEAAARIGPLCRDEMRIELLEVKEDIELDPVLRKVAQRWVIVQSRITIVKSIGSRNRDWNWQPKIEND